MSTPTPNQDSDTPETPIQAIQNGHQRFAAKVDQLFEHRSHEVLTACRTLICQLAEAHQAFAIATDQLVQVQSELRQAREENTRLREALADCASHLEGWHTMEALENARKLLTLHHSMNPPPKSP